MITIQYFNKINYISFLLYDIVMDVKNFKIGLKMVCDYFANPAISQSKLKELKLSPKHFWEKYINPNYVKDINTDAMIFGTAVHMNLFEHQRFINTYTIEPKFDKRTVAGKTAYNEWLTSNVGRESISQENMQHVKKIRDSILNKKLSKIIFANGLAEHELYWKDPITNINCKAKLDWFIEPCDKFPNGLIVDLKTTMSAQTDEFIRSIIKFGYYNQVAFYCEGVKINYNLNNYPEFLFIPVEKIPPYENQFLFADSEMLNIGLKENSTLLQLYANCYNNDKWPGYSNTAEYISLPDWFLKKIN